MDALLSEKSDLGDGLPVVQPTPARLNAFLESNGLRGDESWGHVPPLDREASASSVALCALLAGCIPEHLGVVRACLRALEDPLLNARGVLTTTGSAALAVIVNGPIRNQLQFNADANCLGPGNCSNASVGRALSLVTRRIGGALSGQADMATMGQPGKYTFCFAENQEVNPWTPLHVERGLAPGQSAVTVIGVSGTVEVADMHAQSADEMIDVLGEAMSSPSAPFLGDEGLVGGGQPLVLLSPEWAATFAAAGLSKAELQRRLHRRAECSLERLSPGFVRALGSSRGIAFVLVTMFLIEAWRVTGGGTVQYDSFKVRSERCVQALDQFGELFFFGQGCGRKPAGHGLG